MIVGAKAGSKRRIPISPETVESLRRHLARHGREKHQPPYLFVTERGNWLRAGRANALLRAVVKKAPGLRPITLCNLRHTGITLFGEAGVHISVAQYMAGHSTSDLTIDVYTHLDEPQHREAIARTERLVSNAGTAA